MGLALGRLLHQHGEPVAALASRDAAHAAAGADFIGTGVAAVPYSKLPKLASRIVVAVPDNAITEVAGILAQGGMNRGSALHTSGALGPEALEPLLNRGVSCAVLHPLQTVPTPEQGLTALRGIAFAITGSGPAALWAEHIAQTLEGQILQITPEAKSLYHAAAVVASNCLIGLIAAAAILMSEAGLEREQALRAIAPMVKASAHNALQLGPEKALTGPIQRGDIATVTAHLTALTAAPPIIRELYQSAGLQTLDLARRSGLDEGKASEMESLLRENGVDHGCKS